jgi:hypothetical protein
MALGGVPLGGSLDSIGIPPTFRNFLDQMRRIEFPKILLCDH